MPPIIMPPINRSNRGGSKLAAVGGLIFSLLCSLAILSRTTSMDVFTDSLQRSLNAETTSSLLYLRTSDKDVADNSVDNSIDDHATTNSSKYQPIDCQSFLMEAKKTGTEINKMDPNKGVIYGKQVDINPKVVSPKFWVSLHAKEFDPTRWGIMDYGFYYERSLSDAFIEVLADSPPGSRVIDVGGNIGFFTLLSAANGPVVVDTFEPNQKNRLRLCESLALNHWKSEHDKDCKKDPQHDSMVNVYPLGVGRKEAVLSFIEHGNPGQGYFMEHQPTLKFSKGLPVVTLDNFAKEKDWFTTRPDIALLKIDIEGRLYLIVFFHVQLYYPWLLFQIILTRRIASERNGVHCH
jgi:FkbM family methyltransferase